MYKKDIKPILSMVLVATILSVMCITLSAYTKVARVATDKIINIIQIQDFEYEEYDFGLSDPKSTVINLNAQ